MTRRPADQPTETAWTTGQLAYYIGMSPDFVSSEIRAGELKASKFGREWRIAKVEVFRYLAAKEWPAPNGVK